MSIVRSTEYFASPGHIHHTGQATAHHARCSFESTERGTCRAILRGFPIVRVRAGLGAVREISNLNTSDRPARLNFCGGFKVPRNLRLPRINSVQEPLRGLSKRFENLLRFFAHDEQETTGAKVWRTQSKGISNP